MNRHQMTLTIVIAALSLLVSVGYNSVSHSKEELTSSLPAPTTTIGGAGGTSIAPLMDKWVAAFRQTRPNIKVNYRPIGSGAGIEEVKQGYLNFGVSDTPLNDVQANTLRRPVIQIPASAGPISIVYNLPGVSIPLKLSPQNLSDIFLGNIISWQDPAIASNNPEVKLPKLAVIVVHREERSGTTDVLTSYLSKVNRDWSSKVGRGLSVNWPVGLGVPGSLGILATVKKTPGTIGYLEASYAKENRLAFASIQNQSGRFVQPSYASATAAVAAFNDALAKDMRTPIVDPPASAVDAYPISGLIFILIPRERPDLEQQQAVQDFIDFAISPGQRAVEELSYAKLPDSVIKQGKELLSRLTANGRPLPFSVCFFH